MRDLVYFVFFFNIYSIYCRNVRVLNGCSEPIWVGILGNAGQKLVKNGGFKLESKAYEQFQLPNDWNGRLWGRTKCEGGRCQTGDCGSIQCNGLSGEPPATLVQLNLSENGIDNYDVSLIDGFNLPISVRPAIGTGSLTSAVAEKYDCGNARCANDINEKCPEDHAVKKNGKVVACKNEKNLFKAECPDAISHHGDATHFKCKNIYPGSTFYLINFCP